MLRKGLSMIVLVTLLCSFRVLTVFADGDAPPTVEWKDAANPSGQIMDMSSMNNMGSVQVQVNTGSGSDSLKGGQGSQTQTSTINVYQAPGRGGLIVTLDNAAAANAHLNGNIQYLINAADSAVATNSSLAVGQAQAGNWSTNANTTMAGNTNASGNSWAYFDSANLHGNTATGFGQVTSNAPIFSAADAAYSGNFNSALFQQTSSNFYSNTSYAAANISTAYTSQWSLYNSLDVGGMKVVAAVQSVIGNSNAAAVTNNNISTYQTQHNYAKNTASLGQQLLNALNPKNIVNAVSNLVTTGKLGGNPTTYTTNVSPGTFGNQMQAALQTLEDQKRQAAVYLLIPVTDARIAWFLGIPTGGMTPNGNDSSIQPPFQWIPVVPAKPSCSHYAIIPGNISAIARHLVPPHPVVVGQDDQKRGADLWWELNIAPTIEEWEELVVTGYGKQCNPFNSYDCVIYEEYGCELHRNYYCERVGQARATATLSAASTKWILEDLSYKYPGANLKNPGFAFSEGAIGACHGNTFVWTITKEKVQVADPGNWDLRVIGVTSGTPVSGARNFNVAGGSFPAYLIDTTIIR